jgi:hypothetical protein
MGDMIRDGSSFWNKSWLFKKLFTIPSYEASLQGFSKIRGHKKPFLGEPGDKIF